MIAEAVVLLFISLTALAVALLVEPKSLGSNLTSQEQFESDRYDEDKY
jgi:hypothetical protein